MLDGPRDDEPDLLAICAILQQFDRDLLCALGYADEAITSLLASRSALPAAAQPGTFTIAAELRAATLARLRAERPEAELALHERAFAYFLARLGAEANPAQRAHDEASCFYHLEALRAALIERREWRRIGQLVAALRGAAPRGRRHLQLLALFEGFGAIREQDYAAGERILSALLEEAALAADLQMRAKNLLAQIGWFHADYDRALALYREVYALAQAIGDRTYQGHALHNMSLIYHELGDFAQALALSSESLGLFRQLGDTYHEAHLLYEVAKNGFQLGRLEDAQEQFEQSSRMYQRLGVTAQLANLYALHGMLAHALGDEAGSEGLYRRSLAISQSEEYADQPVAMDTWLLLGLLFQSQQQWPEALAAYERASALALELQNDHVLALTSFRRGGIFQTQGLGSLALDAYRAAIERLEGLRSAAQIEEVKLGLLGTTQQIYEAMVLLLLRAYPAEAFHYVERARSRAFLDILARKSPELYAASQGTVVTLAELQAHLPPNALLLEYYATGVLPDREHLLHRLKASPVSLTRCLLSEPRIYLFAITHDSFAVHELKLDPNLLGPGAHERHPGMPWLQRRKLRALYNHLIEPAHDLLRAKEQVYIIPHGPLHNVPFVALQASDERYLLDQGGQTVALAPSATVLVRNCLARPPAGASGFLALGYNGARADLQHAEAEARAVARIMQGDAWVGPAPKSQALLGATGAIGGLHIAGHAVFQPADPLGSYLSLGVEDDMSARAVMQHLKVRPDLVSLSACTSGLTRIAPGDELLGLVRAWLYAGAATVVCAFWEAGDIVARLVMERFFLAVRAGAPPGVAFRDAIVAVRTMTCRSLAQTFARWRAEAESDGLTITLPELTPDMDDELPYSDPAIWATFMLIGRA
jgi:CHAT domain-containing protein